MKILLINKFYYLSGGAERYLFEWERLLRAHGHEVLLFSMKHPRNLRCEQERFFVEQVEFRTDLSLAARISAGAHSIWCREARRKMEALLEAEGPPDIAHVHSFIFQLTPSVLAPLARRGVPIVQTCHEYAHICVNQHLYDQRRNEICESCLRYGRLSPLWRRCIKGSWAASATGCAAGIMDAVFGRSRKKIARFFATSRFMRDKLVEGGLPAERIVHMPNFIAVSEFQPTSEPGQYMLFLGRLVQQKGVFTFLDAAASIPEILCHIVGAGPLEKEIGQRVAERNLRNVALLGHLEGQALWDAVCGARAVVVPSEWYEPFGLVILEAMAAGRPVIASRIAGPGEIVSDGGDGILFTPGNAQELATAMRRLWDQPQMAIAMGQRGRRKVVAEHDAPAHYERMMRHFEEVAG